LRYEHRLVNINHVIGNVVVELDSQLMHHGLKYNVLDNDEQPMTSTILIILLLIRGVIKRIS
jgi:hypothetical protein